MAFYKQQSGDVILVENPSMNPQLTTGATLLKAENYNAALQEAGQSVQPVGQPAKEIGILSGEKGADINAQNQQKLFSIEEQMRAAKELLAKGDELGKKAAETSGVPYKPVSGLLSNISGGPATETIVNDINDTISGGGLSLGQQSGLDELKNKEAQSLMALANARSTSDANNPSQLYFWIKRYDRMKTDYENSLAGFTDSIKDLRTKRTELLSPTAKEQELKTKLKDVRMEAEKFKLQTEKDKFSEYEGQTLGFARGRAAEIDIKASFRNQEMALAEKNLLLDLGLHQDAREFEQKTIQQQLDDFKSDFELRQKIEDKINKSEEDVLEKASQLEKDSQKTLFDIMNELEGVDPNKMSPDNLKALEDLAARGNLPFDLVKQALETQNKRKVFEDALKIAQKEKSDITSEKKLILAGSGLNDVMISNIEEGVKTIGMDKVLEDNYTDTQKDAIRKIYGIEKKEITRTQLLQAVRAMGAKDVENYFRSRYSEDDIKQFAKDTGFVGFFKGKATEISDYLSSPQAREKLAELLEKDYEAQGFKIK